MKVAYVDMIGGAAGDMLMGAWVDAGVDIVALERALRTVVADGWELVTERVDRVGISAIHLDLIIPGEDDHAHTPDGDHVHSHHDHSQHDHLHADHDHVAHVIPSEVEGQPQSSPSGRWFDSAHHDTGHHTHHDTGHHTHHDTGHHTHHDTGHRTHHETGHHGHRLSDILAIVEKSGLTRRQIERASAIYRRLADAEARVHGQPVDEVYFHEVGQIDAILDVAGTCIALDLLEIDEIRCSAFPTGHGLVRMSHGAYPNPGPASLDLMRGWPLRTTDVEAELVTVTGAAILTTLAKPGPAINMTLERIGYGAGRKKFAIPNVVRVMIGEAVAADSASNVVVIEANIDDMSPQHYELALERIFAAGALDAWLTPITMKKGRPAITLSAIAAPHDEAAVSAALLRETSTIGVRVRTERRHVLAREMSSVETPYGAVRVKRVAGEGIDRWQPEYDDLLRIARERDLPLNEIVRAVAHAAGEKAPT